MDLPQLVTLAQTGSAAIANAMSSAEKLKGMIERGKPPPAETHAVALNLFKQLLEATEAQMLLKQKLAALQQELDARDEFAQEAARYRLEDTGAGAAVYALKPDDQSDEPMHCICPRCYAQRQKAILQPATDGRNCWVCFACRAEFARPAPAGSGIRVGPVNRGLRGSIDDF